MPLQHAGYQVSRAEVSRVPPEHPRSLGSEREYGRRCAPARRSTRATRNENTADPCRNRLKPPYPVSSSVRRNVISSCDLVTHWPRSSGGISTRNHSARGTESSTLRVRRAVIRALSGARTAGGSQTVPDLLSSPPGSRFYLASTQRSQRSRTKRSMDGVVRDRAV